MQIQVFFSFVAYCFVVPKKLKERLISTDPLSLKKKIGTTKQLIKGTSMNICKQVTQVMLLSCTCAEPTAPSTKF